MNFFLLFSVLIILILLGFIAWIVFNLYKKTLPMQHMPFQNYHFQVNWGGTKISFTEVSGLDVETSIIEHRSGSNPEFHTQKMPGQHHFKNLILRRGLFAGDNEFFQWIATGLANKPEYRDLTISLLDANHEPAFVWKIKNAFPVRYSGPVLQAKGSEVAMEELELAYESFTVEAL